MTATEHDRGAELPDFYRLHEQSAREREFLDTHTENWFHGLPKTYNVIEYDRFHSTGSNAHFQNGNRAESYFAPKVVMNKVQPQNSNTRLSSMASTQSELKHSQHTAEFKLDKNASPFSGLFHIPAFSYSFPGHPNPESISAYVYQAHFEVGEITYMFGGIFEDPQLSLRSMGIPRSTDMSRISVHLPYDLPPYVNKEILMSPMMAQNPAFIMFNPARGTVTAYDIDIVGDTRPGNLCMMKGTLVSPHQVFYSGGFEVKVDSVNFDESTKRWIVKKSIVVNDDGYILNVTNMLMTKIELKSKLDIHYSGRLGGSLVLNVFQSHSYQERYVALPVGNTTASGPINFTDLVENDLEAPRLDVKKDSVKLIKDTLKKDTSSSLAPTSSSSNRVSIRVVTEQTPQRTISSGSARSTSKQSDTSKGSGSPLSPSSSASTSTKVSSMFQKSTRIFHRNSVRHNGQAPMQSAYSNQVKQHRSQTLLSSHTSRPTSPLRLSMKSPTSRQADALSIASESTDGDSLHSDHSAPSGSNIATPTPRKGTLNMPAALKSTSAGTESTASAASANYRAFLLEDSALRSDVLSVSVYQFGGFKIAPSDSGTHGFVASDQLLKIELIIDDPMQMVFHPEALIMEVISHNLKSVWPSARGYFAFALVDNDATNETCELVQPQDVPDSDSSKSITITSETFSTSEKSTGRSNRSYNADLFFETKSLMIHGGVNEKHDVFKELLFFSFSTGKWLAVPTYAFDYYNIPKQPYEDENTKLLTLEAQVDNAALVEAEYRCCHHQALIIEEDGRQYVTFLGGFTNDFLRHHEKTPYTSNKFDVSRISRFLLSSTNSNLLRVPVLNLRSQTWKFSRFFYDLSERVSPQAMDILMGNDFLRNARISFYGGALSIVGKQITICHGLAEFVPEKKEDFSKVKKYLEADSILLGGHCHLTFPSL